MPTHVAAIAWAMERARSAAEAAAIGQEDPTRPYKELDHEQREAITNALREAGYVAILWHIADVHRSRPDLTRDQCMEVLEAVEWDHDANLGVRWETLEINADELFPTDQFFKKHPVRDADEVPWIEDGKPVTDAVGNDRRQAERYSRAMRLPFHRTWAAIESIRAQD